MSARANVMDQSSNDNLYVCTRPFLIELTSEKLPTHDITKTDHVVSFRRSVPRVDYSPG